jgi:primosomal protein N'
MFGAGMFLCCFTVLPRAAKQMYNRLIRETLDAGKQYSNLLPEIRPDGSDHYRQKNILVKRSGVTTPVYDENERVRSGSALRFRPAEKESTDGRQQPASFQVILGARSALFCP